MEDLARQLLAVPEDFHSDDYASTESEPEREGYKRGFRTCAEIFKHAIEDRKRSAKQLKNHRVEGAAPATNEVNRLWIHLL